MSEKGVCLLKILCYKSECVGHVMITDMLQPFKVPFLTARRNRIVS